MPLIDLDFVGLDRVTLLLLLRLQNSSLELQVVHVVWLEIFLDFLYFIVPQL